MNACHLISNTDFQLKDKLKKLKQEKEDFLIKKCNLLQKFNFKEIAKTSTLQEEIGDIDREVEALSQVISTSINLAMSIISPIKEREKCIHNITNTVNLLNIENQIKVLLSKLRSNEKSKIENKINIILEASEYIRTNPTVFDVYRESFLKESEDVLTFLNNNFDELRSKLSILLQAETKLNVKECNFLINEMDKNAILSYKLTNVTLSFDKFFVIISDFILKAICKNTISEYESLLSNQQPNANKFKEMLETLSRNLITKIFLKISSIINERKLQYFKEFKNYKILDLLINRILINIESAIEKIVEISLKISEKMQSSSQELDNVCNELTNIMCNFEKFRFFIYCLIEKITLASVQENNIIAEVSNFQEVFKKFNTLLYDLGERYASAEIKFMKSKLHSLFKEESLSLSQSLEKKINSNFDELAGSTLNCIDDFFFILQISGSRSVSSLNLQMSLAIINNIKSILSDELLELLDLKISAVLIKTENRNIFTDVKYSCKEDPNLSYKFTYANLFLITCINCIDQSRNNMQLLFEELKNLVTNEIVDSPAFNHREIVLGLVPEEEEKLNQKIKYLKHSDVELINITFSDLESLYHRYEDFLNRKIKLAFEFLYPNIKSSVDLINSVNYLIDSRSIQNVELSESFAGKFLEETDKILKQWRTQLSEGGFNKFLSFYAEYVGLYIEKALMLKNYSIFGVILLDKVINSLIK
jgi:hypothetical protein